jgi:transketolase
MEVMMPLTEKQIEKLNTFSKKTRCNTIHCIAHLGVGHIGGSLSIVDLLALLYEVEMNVDPEDQKKENRDMLVISKGHSGPALYSTLSMKGFFPISWLDTLNKGGTSLPSHCDRVRTPGVDMSTGSLGQGLSAACGMALGNKMKSLNNYTYAIIGDGESQEGQNWEAAMFAPQYELNHLIAFTDSNKLQIDGSIDDVMSLIDLDEKWKSFGWNTLHCNGHNFSEMHDCIEKAKGEKTKPTMIILDTIKGKGMKVFENEATNHNAKVTIEQAIEATGREGYYEN